MLTRTQIREASRMIQAILEKIYDGTLASDGPLAAAVVRRLEGAAAALKTLIKK